MSKLFQYSGAVLVASFCGVVMTIGFINGGWTIYQNFQSGFTLVYEAPPKSQSAIINLVAPKPVFDRTTTLTFVGDIMLDRGVEYYVDKMGAGDFDWLFQNITSLAAADILFGNLEGPVSDQGSDRRNLYSFRMNPDVLPALDKAGFDVLQVANNHIGDWGLLAAQDTLKRLDDTGLVAVGGGFNREAITSPKVIKKNDLRIGFLAATDVGPDWLVTPPNSVGVLLANDPELPQIISNTASQVDFLVVGYHFGEEYQTEPNERQRELAHLAIDNGANLVIGTHPHVVQPIERYKGGMIAYSLGNFIFDQYFSPETMSGMVLTVVLEDKKIKSAIIQKVVLDSTYQPTLE